MKVSEILEKLAATDALLVASDAQLKKAQGEIVAKLGILQTSVDALTGSVAELEAELADAVLTADQEAAIQKVADDAAIVAQDAQALDDIVPDAPPAE